MARHSSITLAVAITLFSARLAAQQVQWLNATPNDWILNPLAPVDALCARDPEHVYTARLDAISYTYNQPMGAATLSRLAGDGAVVWNVSLGDTVQMESIVSDADGNVVVGGRYFQRLLVNGLPVLSVPPGHVSEGSFLCAFDSNGSPLWQQDVSGSDIESVSVSSLALDPQGHVWAALSTFMGAAIVRLGSDGSQLESRSLTDSKTIGSISFDPWGGLYVSGAAGSPSIEVNGTGYPVTEEYAFFVTRMNADGGAQWLRYAHDITLQKPRVRADITGHAFLLGSYTDPLTWGNIPFTDPRWSVSFFLARVDSLGDFDWGVQPPNTQPSGQFTLARGNSLGVDADGNAYVIGTLGGTMDWGNGLVTGSGDIVNNTVVLMKFDNTGAPALVVQGGSTQTDIMNDLAVTSDGICHFIGITSDPFALGPFTVDPVNARGTVVARVDPDLGTDLQEAALTDADPIACPSVFTTGFRLVGPSLPDRPSVSVTIVDATGRTVERAIGLGEKLGEGLAPGAYTVLVRSGEMLSLTRVVKAE